MARIATRGGLPEDFEIRAVPMGECRSVADGLLQGYPIVFNSLSLDLGGFVEQVSPRAVDRMLNSNADVFGLIDHELGRAIARRSIGTLTFSKDARGLFMKMRPADTTDGRDALEMVRSGLYDRMSFGFRTIEDSWNWDTDPLPTRTLLDIEIREVSIVALPAYPATVIGPATRAKIDAALEQRRRRLPTETATEMARRLVSERRQRIERFRD